MASIGIFLGAIVLFVFQVAPLAVSCLTLMVLLPYFKITDLATIWAKFGGTSFFFVFFCFGVTGALSNTTLPMRISAWITKVSKGNPKFLIFGFIFVATLMSGFLSNFGTLIMFYGIVIMFLRSAGLRPGESQLGKCLMIGLPFACGNGGFITPAGSPGNLIAQSLFLEAGHDISFLKWFLMCVPFPLIMALLVSISLIVIFKPEPMPVEAQKAVLAEKEKLGPMESKEKKAIVIIVATVILWFAGTWVPALNTTVVAGCAFFLMFMPGIDLMDWKSYVREADWNLLMMVGSVAITMGCVNDTGAMTWIANKLFSGLGGLSIFLVMLIVGLVVCYLRVLIPTAPSVAAIFVPIMIGISGIVSTGGANYDIALGMIPVFWAGATITLLYTEPIYLYTYGAGYYSAMDLFKAGLIPTLIMVVIVAGAFPTWFGLFGF
jgi:sodium-dependent dicarboxylate transporter 2/3/5